MTRICGCDKPCECSKSPPALKYDQEKLPWELLPFEAIEEMVAVLRHGRDKYTTKDKEGNILFSGGHNWRKGFEWSRLIGASYRHLTAFTKGKDKDGKDNGTPKFDKEKVFEFAAKNQVTNLELAFKMMNFDKLTEAAQKKAINDYKKLKITNNHFKIAWKQTQIPEGQ